LKARADAARDGGGGTSGDAAPDLGGDTSGQIDALSDRTSGDFGADLRAILVPIFVPKLVSILVPSLVSILAAPPTPRFAPAAPRGRVASRGPFAVAAFRAVGSRREPPAPGLLYAHNDSGDTARFFALTAQAHVNAELHLSGATATDWEDISVGPCPTAPASTSETRETTSRSGQYVIHRLPEPATLPTDGSVLTITSYDSFPFVYPTVRTTLRLCWCTR